ncbi:Retrovirus-related Pol polyprotein from transposon TNT 1-94 [Senna tora]|uniref:Retrovirus-related Pol polyprotein from transposon TNT 1-94 n=1 Tax=Senna tora TaxID=362788 RepID=A0A834SCX9_9FABA|nr:Retrovirus-related Pol polyprotein from transposon TNT 1-94 [Senna tora]
MAEKAYIVYPQTPQSSSTSSIPLIEKERNVIAFNHNLSVKLDDMNYLLWRQQILAALEDHDMEKYIAGSRFVPPKFDTEGDRDAGKLKQFGINTKARVHLYKTELRGIKKGTKTMSEFLLKIKAIAGALRAIGSPISEHEHMQYILEGLPQDLKAVKSIETPSANVASVDQKDKNNQNKSNQPGPFRDFNNFRGGRNGGGRFNNYRGGSGIDRGGSTFYQGLDTLLLLVTIGMIPIINCLNNNIVIIATSDAVNDAAWFPDSGATNHVTSDASNLMNDVEYTAAEQLHMGNGKGLLITNVGQSLVKSSFQPRHNLVLINLLHVPSITKNLVSVSKFSKDNSVFFEFHYDACYVKSQATKATLLKGSVRPNGLYYFTDFKLLHQSSLPDCSIQSFNSSVNLSSSSAPPVVLASTIGTSVSNSVTRNCTDVTPYTLWHCCLGHCNSATVKAVLKQCNFAVSNKGAFDFCGACCKGKHHKLPHPPSPNVYNTPLELIYTDLWGPSPIKSRNGASYYISFIDACSRFTCIYPLKNKSNALQTFTEFKNMIELQTGFSIKTLQSDEGASPPLAIQYETSVKPVTVTNTNNCVVSTNEMVCVKSVSTGVGGSTKSDTDVDSSTFSDPEDLSTLKDQATNVHPMVTRAKAGVFKPKILLAHVVPTGSSSQFISQLKCRLNAEFSLKDLGKHLYFLGIEGKYIQDLLVKSKMDGACAISTPTVSNAKLSRDCNNVMADPSLYRSTVVLLSSLILMLIGQVMIMIDDLHLVRAYFFEEISYRGVIRNSKWWPDQVLKRNTEALLIQWLT